MHIFDGQIERYLADKEELKTVEKLDIYDKNASLEQLNTLLKNCPALKELEISIDQIDTFPSLVHCPQIRFIKFTGFNQEFTFNLDLPENNKLEILILKAPIKKIDVDFSKLNHLISLSFERCLLDDYSFINNLNAPLQTLYINEGPPWKGLVDISRFTELSALIIDNCQDEKFNFKFGSESKLRRINVKRSKFLNVVETFKACPNINMLGLENVPAISLMDLLDNFGHSKQLWIRNVEVLEANEIPTQTNKVEFIYLENNRIEFEHFDFLSKCLVLDSLRLENNTINSPLALLRDKPVPLSFPSEDLLPSVKFKDFEVFLKFCNALTKTKLDRESKEYFLLYFADRSNMVLSKKWDWATLLKASNINYASFRNKLKELINEKIKEQETINFTKNSVFYITGNPKVKKTELKKQMKDLGLQFVSKYTKEVTHVIIGMKSSDYDLLADKEFIAITDNLIQQAYLDTQDQYIKDSAGTEDGDQMVESLELLLKSKDETNFSLAVEMIKSGGLPEGLFEHLLVVNKTSESSIIRKDSKELLEIHAPREWMPLIANRISFKAVNDPNKSEIDIRKQFASLAKKVKPAEVGKFSQMMYRITGRGLRYSLTAGLAKSVKKEAYALLYKDNHFDFATGLGFSKKMDQNLYDEYGHLESSVALPVLALDLGPVHSLNLKNCCYESIDEKITKFTNLKRLDYSYNLLGEVPYFFTELTALEELNLSHNSFEKFPILLAELPNLKQVDLRGNDVDKIPASFKKANPDCVVLIDK